MLQIQCTPVHITKTFRLPEDLVQELSQLAADHDISLNNLVIQCLQYALEHIDREAGVSPPSTKPAE